jgi:hypothetical protein
VSDTTDVVDNEAAGRFELTVERGRLHSSALAWRNSAVIDPIRALSRRQSAAMLAGHFH